MFFPYRAKNPPVVFPWVTVLLIALNVIIFACTSHYFWTVREDVVMQYGLIHNRFSIERLFVSMFLHASFIHLLGNMLFLWVFGGSVEGRMGWYLYLPFYITVGLAAGVTHDLMSGVFSPDIPMIGASGAIMGVLGAFLWLSPYAHIMVAYWVRFRAGTTTWTAMWLIGLYFAIDVLEGFLYRGSGASSGTANFAHVGGALAGFVIAAISGMARESEEFSDAQAMRSDMGSDLTILSVYELQSLIEGPQPQVEAVFAFCRKRLRDEGGYKPVLETLIKHQDLILTKGDAQQFAIIALDIPQSAGRLPSRFLMGLGQKLEIEGAYDLAARVYRHVMIGNETAPDTEMALVRLARLTDQTNADKNYAAAIYAEQLRLFPNGPQAALARTALARLPKPNITFLASEGRHQGPGTAAPQPMAPAAAPASGPAPAGYPLAGVGGMAPIGPAPAPAPTGGGMAPVGMASIGGPAPVQAPTPTTGIAPVGMAPMGMAPVAPPPPPAAPPSTPPVVGLASVGSTPVPRPAAPTPLAATPMPPPPPTPPTSASTPEPGQPVIGSPLPAGFWDTPRQAPATAQAEEAPAPQTSLPPIFLAPVGSNKPGGDSNPSQ